MRTPDNQLAEIRELEKSVAEGRYPVSPVGIFVATCIVQNRDPELLEVVSENVRSWLRSTIASYKEEGKLIHYFNTGTADHTELMRNLVEVLEHARS